MPTTWVGWNALFWAALSRRTDTLRALVAKGADVNARDNEKGQRCSGRILRLHGHRARPAGEGARANARDSHGWTALMSAADLGHIDAVRALLEKGADVHVRGKDGTHGPEPAKKYKLQRHRGAARKRFRTPPDKSPNGASGATGWTSWKVSIACCPRAWE